MLIGTKYFGKKEINESKIITFSEGLPGFEERTKFVLLEHSSAEPIYWLQSIEDEKLAFATIIPQDFYSDYTIDLNSYDVAVLDLKSPEEALVLAILVVPADPTQMTVNLQAPLVINKNKHLGKQVILGNQAYKIKHYLFNDLKAYREHKKENLLANAK